MNIDCEGKVKSVLSHSVFEKIDTEIVSPLSVQQRLQMLGHEYQRLFGPYSIPRTKVTQIEKVLRLLVSQVAEERNDRLHNLMTTPFNVPEII